MIDWIKNLYRIVRDYDSDMKCQLDRIKRAEDFIRENTTVNADIHHRGLNQIIVIGRYKNQDYVRIYSIDEGDFGFMVQELNRLQKEYGRRGFIDSPPQIKELVIDRQVYWT